MMFMLELAYDHTNERDNAVKEQHDLKGTTTRVSLVILAGCFDDILAIFLMIIS
jgi:hypothetical protein